MKIIKRLLWIGMALNVILLFTSAFYNKSKVLTFIVLLGTGIQAGTVLIFFRYINKPLQDLLKYRNLSDDEEKKQSIETGIQKIEDSELKNIFSSIMDYVLLVSKENNAEIFTKQTELSALQSQINPHFLYNTLDTIRGQAMIDGNKEVADMIEKLASFFRYSISRKGNMVTLRDELANVKNYISIQEYRFNNRFRLFIDIDEDDEEVYDFFIPRLILQPLVENAVIHGFENVTHGGLITIDVMKADDLVITVSDNGCGMPLNILDKLNNYIHDATRVIISQQEGSGMGIALTNVNKRIQLLYGKKYGLNIYSTNGQGTDVEVLLPIINQKENT